MSPAAHEPAAHEPATHEPATHEPSRTAPAGEVVSWVVGRGGLLGRAVEGALARSGPIWHPAEPFPWGDDLALARRLEEAVASFVASTRHARWQVLWCAGAGVVGSRADELDRETRSLVRLLEAIGSRAVPGRPLGAFFLASSAGGAYAGSSGPPFTEASPTRALAPYGENKLKQETLVRAWAGRTGTPVLIGRISNLYGPGQNVSKNQGLITIVCRRILARQPLVLYVPLDTIRDYCYVADASRLVTDGMRRLREEAPIAPAGIAPVVLKIIASQQPATIGTVLATAKWVTKRPAKIVLAASPSARWQARDLRVVSNVWPELDRHPVTPLGAGLRNVVNDLLQMTERGDFSRDIALRT